MTKMLACEANISDEVHTTAGLGDNALPRQEVEIRGRAEPMTVRVVIEAKVLSALIDNLTTVAA
jgi:adenylate cyclase